MSFFDLNNIAFTALNYPMSWVELIAVLAGIAAVWLSAREHIANWRSEEHTSELQSPC